jgi:trans-aconitate methyltransferase
MTLVTAPLIGSSTEIRPSSRPDFGIPATGTIFRNYIGPRDHELEIGGGWGSLTLYLAERFPGTEIVAVSNSATQKAHINKCCTRRGFTNVEVVTADINDFAPAGRFDRVLSIEMFEHMSNYRALLQRIAAWLERMTQNRSEVLDVLAAN